MTLEDGIRVTSPARTACDLASVLGEEDLASVIEQVLDTFDLRSHTIERTARTMLAPGWRGSSTLRRVLAQRAPGSSPQDSHLEVRLGRALVAAGLPAPVPQHPIPLDDGVVVRADLAYPSLRLASRSTTGRGTAAIVPRSTSDGIAGCDWPGTRRCG